MKQNSPFTNFLNFQTLMTVATLIDFTKPLVLVWEVEKKRCRQIFSKPEKIIKMG